MIFIGSSTIEERKQAAFERLKCAGQPRITGAFLGFFTFAVTLLFLQNILLNLLIGLFPWAKTLEVFIVLMAFSSCLCGLMLFSSTWFDKASVFQSLSAPAVFFICLAGGAFWSLELIPAQLKLLSQATPIYWAMESLMNLTLGSQINGLALAILFVSGPALSQMAEARV